MPPMKLLPNRKKRSRLEQGQGSGSSDSIAPDFRISRTNKYLFRDDEAHTNFIGQFAKRTIADCYYFDKSTVTFHHPEDTHMLNYLNLWSWDPFLSCNEPYTELLTRTFYSNLRVSDTPFLLSSYVCGREITITLEKLSNWLEVPNEGEETYLLRDWPSFTTETADQYKTWFDRTNVAGASLYASKLPSLHRLLFTLINNILIPKATRKTNIERGPMYYLRHLIQMDKQFNIPYIVMKHMRSAFISTVASLPYPHFIHKIIRLNGLELPENQALCHPIHLVDLLPKMGWVLYYSESGLTGYRPDDRSVNKWINQPGALPNQYWDPNEEVQDEPAQVPQVPNPQVDENPQVSQTISEQLKWIIDNMKSNHLETQNNFKAMKKEIQSVRSIAQRNSRKINTIDKTQQRLMARFVHQFGASSSGEILSPHDEEEDDENEDEEAEEDDDINDNDDE